MNRIAFVLNLSLITFAIACSTENANEEKTSVNNNTVTVKEEKYQPPKLTDTLEQSGYKYYIQSLKGSELTSFKTLPNNDEIKEIQIKCPDGKDYCPGEVEKIRIREIADSTLVIRDGKDLKLRLKDSTYAVISSNINTHGDDYEAYYFLKYIDDIGLFILDAHYYEGAEVILVNTYNGEKISVEGNYPVLSPERDRIIVTSTLFSIGSPDAITIFEIKDQSIKKILSYSNGWGALKANWIDNNTLKIEQELNVPENNEVEEKDKKYCKLIILPKE